jgi:hypothetical protein
LHDVIYNYYRLGLDKLYESEPEARNSILQTLNQLVNFNKENANTMFMQFFMQNKSTELIGIFKNGTPQEKQQAIDALSLIDIANTAKYREQLR